MTAKRIAKRIEEGLRDVMASLAYYPGAINSIIAAYDTIVEEEGRISDVVTGYLTPMRPISLFLRL